MIKVAISGTGLFVPSQTITNDELVESFNAYVAKFNTEHAAEIASGELQPLQPSTRHSSKAHRASSSAM